MLLHARDHLCLHQPLRLDLPLDQDVTAVKLRRHDTVHHHLVLRLVNWLKHKFVLDITVFVLEVLGIVAD